MEAVRELNLSELESKDLFALRECAEQLGVSGVSHLKKQELIFRMLQCSAEQQGHIFAEGVLETVDETVGFLRQTRLLPGPNDIYVSMSQIRRFGLRTGDLVAGQVRAPKETEKYFGLLRVEAVNGVDPDIAKLRPHFEELTPVHPREMFELETKPKALVGRLIDLVAPIGRGQRGLVVAPPKAGTTTLLRHIAEGINANSTSTHLMVVLVGGRPEEVTDWQRTVDGDVLSATCDEPAESHVRIAEMALERAKRLVECGRDVVVLLDSITRLARSYNLAVFPGGRTLACGLDPAALYPSKRFFGAARNIEGGGSLTIIGTCVVDSGSSMDDGIYEEFRGTGNHELTLDGSLQERRIFPAIDMQRSGTHREELLLDPWVLQRVRAMRRMLTSTGPVEGVDLLMNRLKKSADNHKFLESLDKDVA